MFWKDELRETISSAFMFLIVQGTFDPTSLCSGGASSREPAPLENVGIDHGGFDVFVSEEFLNGTNVIAILEKMGREGVAEGVR